MGFPFIMKHQQHIFHTKTHNYTNTNISMTTLHETHDINEIVLKHNSKKYIKLHKNNKTTSLTFDNIPTQKLSSFILS